MTLFFKWQAVAGLRLFAKVLLHEGVLDASPFLADAAHEEEVGVLDLRGGSEGSKGGEVRKPVEVRIPETNTIGDF